MKMTVENIVYISCAIVSIISLIISSVGLYLIHKDCQTKK